MQKLCNSFKKNSLEYLLNMYLNLFRIITKLRYVVKLVLRSFVLGKGLVGILSYIYVRR